MRNCLAVGTIQLLRAKAGLFDTGAHHGMMVGVPLHRQLIKDLERNSHMKPDKHCMHVSAQLPISYSNPCKAQMKITFHLEMTTGKVIFVYDTL